eukprot:jgi/Galph1/3437/GphlegSOOS_G2102.1
MERYTQKAVDATKIFTTHMTTNELKRAVTKATLDEETKPRLKDVKKIIRATYLRPSTTNTKCGPRKVLKYLQQRLEAAEYAVVLRALLVCHILLDEGSKSFIDLLLHSAVTFNLPYLRDHISEYAQYTRAFGHYLQEKIITIRTLGMPYDTIPDPSKKNRTQIFSASEENEEEYLYGDVNKLEFSELLQVLPVLETQRNQTEALVAVRLSSDAAYNDVTVGVLERLVKDLLPLMKQLNDGMNVILEEFFTLSKSNCEQCYKLYEKYIEIVHSAEKLMGIASRLGASESGTSVEHVALDYLPGMKEHLGTVKETKDDKSSATKKENNDKLDVHKESYDEAAAVAAAIRESLKTGKSSEMITFDDEDDESDDEKATSTASGSDREDSSTNELDEFFGLFKDTKKTPEKSTTSSKKTPEKKKSGKKKKSSGQDDLLDLFSDASISSSGDYPNRASMNYGMPPTSYYPPPGYGYPPPPPFIPNASGPGREMMAGNNPFQEPYGPSQPSGSAFGSEEGNPFTSPYEENAAAMHPNDQQPTMMPPPTTMQPPYPQSPSSMMPYHAPPMPDFPNPSLYPPPYGQQVPPPWNNPMGQPYPYGNHPNNMYGSQYPPPYGMHGGMQPEMWQPPSHEETTPFDTETSTEGPFDELNPFSQ